MKNKIAIVLLLAIMISLAACVNIYTGPTQTGTTEPGIPTVTTTVTTTASASSTTTSPTLNPTVKPTVTPKVTITPTIFIPPTFLTTLIPFEDKV